MAEKKLVVVGNGGKEGDPTGNKVDVWDIVGGLVGEYDGKPDGINVGALERDIVGSMDKVTVGA